MFDRILIANRAEIAVRIARTCRALGVEVVAVYSDVDARSLHVGVADEAVNLPGVAATDTYLNADALLAAARKTDAQAIHPGYGFLAESAAFAEAVTAAGLKWIGPPAEAMRLVGDKISARRLASDAGVPVVPGLTEAVKKPGEVKDFAAQHGYPVAVKAAGGGGGRGLRVVRTAGEITAALDSARREADAYFGSSTVFVERYLDAPKHLEVQLLAPSPTEALWLGVRDCSLQRRHQKLIEETPPPLYAEILESMGASAVALSKACGYVNAGTVEFLVDDSGAFYFLEVNARLQVEHTVTEEVLGLDLVACQLEIASGDGLGFTQVDLTPHGVAIECRINAEDPARGFIPTPGVLTRYVEPTGMGLRVDSGYLEGDEVPAAYDSLVAKVIVTADDRESARRRMLTALDDMIVEGVATTIGAHTALLGYSSFVAGTHTTRTVEDSGVLDALLDRTSDARHGVLLVGEVAVRLWNPAMAPSAATAGGPRGDELHAPMQGTILKVAVKAGERVESGQPLIVLEAMKMETTIAAPRAGTVTRLDVSKGDGVGAGQVLAVIG